MDALTAAALAAIAVLAFLAGRSLLFPPVVFAGVWAMALALVALAGDALYPISDAARSVFFFGAVGFAIGGVAGHVLAGRILGKPAQGEATLDPRRVAWFVDATIIALIVGIPFYRAELQEALRVTAAATLLQAARMRALQASAGLVPALPPVLSNLIQLSIVVTLIAFATARRTAVWWVRAGTIFLLSLAYQVFTGGRAGAALLIFGVIGIIWLRAGRVRLLRVLPALVAFVLIFELIAIQLQKGFIRRGLTLQENLPAMIQDFRSYLIGGVVSFDRVVQYPDEIPSTGGIWRTAEQLANRFGAHYEIPPLHAQYTTFGDFNTGNVYSAYFQYVPEFGIVGSMMLLAIAGSGCAVAYAWGRRGSLAGTVFYGITFVAMLQSVLNEAFYTNLNLMLKTVLLLVLVYAVCRRHPYQREAGEIV